MCFSLLLDGWAALADVSFDDLLPLPLGFEDEFDGVAQGAVASSVRRDVVSLLLHFGASVFHGNGEACGAHGGEIDDIVADEGGLIQLDSIFFDDFLESSALVLDALAHVLELEIASAEGDRFGDALGDESGLDAGQACEGDGSAVVSVKALGLNQRLAVKAKSTLSAVVRGFFENALLNARRSGEDEQLAIGEDTVDVEKEEFDFAGAGLSGESWH